MNECKVTLHPVFAQVIENAAELEEERTQLQMVMEKNTFERVRGIIEKQPAEKRAAYYGTIFDATCAGQDFSRVESLEEIADIYARFIIGRALEA